MLPIHDRESMVTLNSLSQILQDHPERGRRVEVTSNEVGLMRLDE